ncbi:MAG: hypothetical protein AM326_01045 [Candidatus Thorarchaeota archaeon SMTZ-45]|nr:MAG: hypothetical protein AM326_01045 [Candidatus Thorarchaeota archaeon SMTZ-45]
MWWAGLMTGTKLNLLVVMTFVAILVCGSLYSSVGVSANESTVFYVAELGSQDPAVNEGSLATGYDNGAVIAEKAQQDQRSQFCENIGQIDEQDVMFYGRIPGGWIGFGLDKVILLKENTDGRVILSFEGSFGVAPRGVGLVQHRLNYFLGDRGTYTDIRGFTSVIYNEVWPGISVAYRATEKGAKYEFQVSPDGDPSNIKIRCDGHDSYKLESTSLSLLKDKAAFVDEGLKAFQDEKTIEAKFVARGPQTFGVEVGDFDHSQMLVIDPLLYSTYIGGSDMEGYAESGPQFSVAVDSSGCAYVTGFTESSDFPFVNGYANSSGDWDCVVFKLSASGDYLHYSTYVGGSNSDVGRSIAVDALGNAYVTGHTNSMNFPLVNAYDSTLDNADCFVFKLDADGASLNYSTFVGDSGSDYGESIEVDSSGNAYVTGWTTSSNFPLVNAYDNTYNGDFDCFVFKLSISGDSLDYSTYVGGSGKEGEDASLAIDSLGNAYITCATNSADFPFVNAYDSTLDGNYDCVVFKLNSTGNGLLYSTLVGGSGSTPDVEDKSFAIAIDSTGSAYVTGNTYSSDFPTVNAYDSSLSYMDCFVFKLNAAGNDLLYSTFVGGDSMEFAFSIAVDDLGSAYVTGVTSSSDFPTVEAYNDTRSGPERECFVFKVNSTGNDLLYSTFIGGTGKDTGNSISVDSSRHAYVVGVTTSSDFPTVNSYDDSYNGGGLYGGDVFVFKISEEEVGPQIALDREPELPGPEDTVTVTATVTDPNGVAEVILSYSNNSESTWTNITMNSSGINEWTAIIPVHEDELQIYYKVYAKDNLGNWALSSTVSYIVGSATTPPTTTTPTTTTGPTPGPTGPGPDGLPMTLAMVGGGIGLAALGAAVIMLRRRRGWSEPRERGWRDPMERRVVSETVVAAPEDVPEVEEPELELPEDSEEGVQVLRGCAVVGGRFEYKVKVVNNTDYVITNIMISIIAFPEDCMELSGNRMKTIGRIEPRAFRSPQFAFIPTKDCVEGQIIASVSYVDHQNKLETVEVEPYVIRSVCDLLKPLKSTLGEFEQLLLEMTSTSEVQTVGWNSQVLFSKVKALLPLKNFHVIESTDEVDDGMFRGTIRGLAEGKYTGKKVAVRVAVSGAVDGKDAKVLVEGLGDDEAMLPTTIEELAAGIRTWICMNCGAALDPEEVRQLQNKVPIQCRYCKYTMTVGF